ncbi:PAS domain S-box protein [Desulfatitalea alkaliphila]|uniref:histidine kinase n=1 Tax=Desulfatitalea alkaliphila TaxID=2929485 RepID=A0AA41ULI6_9BACT|nr:PAS domain S-box protein [Desulfatitalea alkaliphila]MCJ8501556.1 PAS domain S-box protein [Desulfatitalea alkaliphila]
MTSKHKRPGQITDNDLFLKAITDASPVGMVAFDGDGNVVFANALAERLFGNSVDTQGVQRWGDWIACAHRHADPGGCGHTENCPASPLSRAIRNAVAQAPDAAVIEGDALLDREAEQPSLRVRFKVNGTLINGKNAAVMTIEDITDRKKAADMALQSDKRYRDIFDNAPIGIFQTTSEGRFLSVNPEYARIAGYSSPSEMIEQITDIAAQLYVRPEERIRYKELLKRKRRLINFEIELKRRDGSTFWASFNTKALQNPDGTFVYDGFLVDISDRVRAEQALRNSESLQRKMVANIGDVIVIIDQEGINRYKSPNIERLFGWRPEEVLGRDALDNVHPEDKQFAQQFLDSLVVVPNATGSAQCRYRCKDGSYKWIEFTGINLLHDPVIQGILGNYHDITDRKQADDELRKQNDFIQAILDNLPIGLAVNSIENGTATYINDAFEQIYGWPKEELKDIESFFEKIYPDPKYRAEIRTRVFNDMASGDPERMQWENVRVTAKDGTDRIVIAKNIPLVEQNVMISTVQDITRQKLAEQALGKERERLAYIIEGTNVGTWEWNLQTGETVFNERWAQIIGYTLEELSPVSIETWIRFSHPEDLQQSEALLAKHFSGEREYYECECRMRHRDGSWVWVLDRGKVSQWNTDGQPLMMSGTHQNITNRKRAEAALRESEERFQKAFIASPAPLVIAEIDTGRFIDVNDRWVRMIGYDRQEQIGRTSTELGIWMNPDDRDLFVRKLDVYGRFKNEPVEFRIPMRMQICKSPCKEKVSQNLTR